MKHVALLFLALTFILPGLAHAARSDAGTPRIMQGPMIGAVTPTTIPVWVRVSGEWPVAVRYGKTPDLSDAATSPPVAAEVAKDLCAVVTLTDLEPDTTYYYEVLVNGRTTYQTDSIHHAKTAPAGSAKFSLAFGSCARTQEDSEQRIWNVVKREDPDLFFWLGDNVYGDSLIPSIIAEEYREQFEVTNLRPLLATTPQLATWDDHDYGLNDHDRTNPVKEQMLEVFKNYWPNLAYGTEEAPGVYFTWQYGGVDFFFVDCRYYRDPNTQPDGPDKTFLGAAQLAWLKDQLAASDAPFKVLVSGSGWTNAKGPGGDSWASALHERDALFNWIRDNNVSGVVLLSGDTHTGELNAIPWSDHGGYDFYDLVSSPLAQTGSTGWRRRDPEVRLRPGFGRANVGIITFDMTLKNPRLTFEILGEDGVAPWESILISADDLVNGVATARDNIIMP